MADCWQNFFPSISNTGSCPRGVKDLASASQSSPSGVLKDKEKKTIYFKEVVPKESEFSSPSDVLKDKEKTIYSEEVVLNESQSNPSGVIEDKKDNISSKIVPKKSMT